jgi:histone acetyltransferase MYST4
MREQAGNISQATWQTWIIDAIRKIRTQKQRPSEDRILGAIRQHHNVDNDEYLAQMDKCVAQGLVLKVTNKDKISFKDPSRLSSRKLTISNDLDLTKAVIKTIREIRNANGCTLKEIEKYLTESRVLNLGSHVDFSSYLKSTMKVAAARGLILQEGKLYRLPAKKEGERRGRKKKKTEPEKPKVSTEKVYFP